MFSILYWGSHPDAGNDDCWQGFDFDTLDDAMAKFNEVPSEPATAYVELDGAAKPGESNLIRKVPGFKPSKDDGLWSQERAMQAGMAFGCAGYNDELGY